MDWTREKTLYWATESIQSCAKEKTLYWARERIQSCTREKTPCRARESIQSWTREKTPCRARERIQSWTKEKTLLGRGKNSDLEKGGGGYQGKETSAGQGRKHWARERIQCEDNGEKTAVKGRHSGAGEGRKTLGKGEKLSREIK